MIRKGTRFTEPVPPGPRDAPRKTERVYAALVAQARRFLLHTGTVSRGDFRGCSRRQANDCLLGMKRRGEIVAIVPGRPGRYSTPTIYKAA